jgi:4-alpha-glucanotransferase
MDTLGQSLLKLATTYGIQTSYIDMRGQIQPAAPESLLLVLKAMGAPVEKIDDVERALEDRVHALGKRKVGPVVVAWDGKLGELQIPAQTEYTLRLEDGGEGKITDTLPSGYHKLTLDGEDETLVISAPTTAFFPSGKHWGLFAPVYALRSERSPGAGDLRDFESLMSWMGELGGSVAATLPLLATFLDEPFDPSPYAPASRLFWNEFYVDIGGRAGDGAGDGTGDGAARLVDYREQMALKRAILEDMARSFFSTETGERRTRFERFVRESQGVEDYARFRAVTDRQGKGWRAWPARLHNGEIREGDYDEGTKRYHLYAQWLIQEQLQSIADGARARGQMLYLDLPLGLHPDGYDVWRDRELFVRAVSGGAPPDRVFTTGQNWRFPPMHPEAMRLDHHRYTIAYIRNHLRYAKLLRIDHVMGLNRLYWIPNELSGDKGVYVEYPADELYAILSVESHRSKAGIVGENLGIVPPEVNHAMARHNIQQMYIVQYEITGDTSRDTLRTAPANCVASLNTHDLPPFQAFLDGTDIDDRLQLGFLTEEDALEERHQRLYLKQALVDFLQRKGFLTSDIRHPTSDILFLAVVTFLAASPANIVLLNLEDLWQEILPQNIPATEHERPNWRRRIKHSMEEARQMPALLEVLRSVSVQRPRSIPL